MESAGTETKLSFRVLGPLEVWCRGNLVPVGGPRLRTVLARLLVDVGRTVSVSAMVEALWREDPPEDAHRTVRTYVSRLRASLERAEGGSGSVLVTRPPGYLLRVQADQIDAGRFAAHAAQGRRLLGLGQVVEARQHLTDALLLWRGGAYGEFDDCQAAILEASRLESLRLMALEDRLEADLAAGLGAEMVAELETLVDSYPARERLWAFLMTALYRAGRQADALAAFRRARTVLIEVHGIEPSPELGETHRRVLAHDQRLTTGPQPEDASTSAGPPTRLRGTAPSQLPFGVREFAGRDAELGQLDELLVSPGVSTDDVGATTPTAVVISALSGTAGVGKTALAVHWARRASHRFPDGQLYVNLRGFAPGGDAVRPTDALRSFLDALGVPSARIPDDSDSRAALFRSTLANRRMILLLDNARDADHVRPLLPGAGGSVALVTSRSRLSGLVAAEGARLLTLDLMTSDEARTLLVSRLGADRVDADPTAVEALIDHCARLPLALAIAAARALTRPDMTLAELVVELREADRRLDLLAVDGDATDVTAVFSWSYDRLSPEAARLFRLLGLHPGPDITTAAAASLAGLTAEEAGALLDELTSATLLSPQTAARHLLHDLLAAYAARLARVADNDQQRLDAVQRLLHHYVHTATAATLSLDPHRDLIALTEPRVGAVVSQFEGSASALEWFAAERPALLAALDLASRVGLDSEACQLAWTMTTYLYRQGHWTDLASSQRAMLGAAKRLGDRRAEGLAWRNLGLAYACLHQLDDAVAANLQALKLAEELQDDVRRGHLHLNLAHLADLQGRSAASMEHNVLALQFYRAADHRIGQARALVEIGADLLSRGNVAQALTHGEEALEIHQGVGDREGQAATQHLLGRTYAQLPDPQRALAAFQRAIDLWREIGDRASEAESLECLGDAQAAAGDTAQAHRTWCRAIDIFDALGSPDADRLRTRSAPPVAATDMIQA